jgi:PEP-CTERM motif
MGKFRIFASCAAVALASAMALPAQAAILNWALGGVTFADGGTASGTFSTDTATGFVTAFNVSTAGGSTLSPFSYTAGTSTVQDNLFAPQSFLLINTAITRYVALVFANPLTAGGVNSLAIGNFPVGSYECDNCNAVRYVTSGFATTVTAAVPEPTSWALMIAGFGLVGGAMRRRRVTVSYA